ncbi:30S ribosomal protein S8 [Candidatus Westeberhardia cardiocondylae]|uniref:Small ribosomal subunit protein uS8 n=1 Tax=Candidatus Westeberhardia cardiocondylae TaxID=1594731 RepID=A0A0H5BWL8_9ENTR|nr:30S ribosomal protein S8 [Candidatus Westeberhardia cardiocondylae]MCR3756176.1 30S ribosomal subunit protein S8 [Candidatus Westeberhardia cardiocondylae]CEN32053.1 30S ribosomal protein S8 [Candidatus Westeberhardia cardiocondylae]
MSMQDPISDMLTCIRNGNRKNKRMVFVPSSKFKIKISDVLQSEGFIKKYQVQHKKKSVLIIFLKYFKNEPVIETIKRVSRPGLRVYKKNKFLPTVMGGMGIAIISTSKGIMTDRLAKNMGIGGEVICYVS